MLRTISWLTLALALLAADPAEAYYPLWNRTSFSIVANIRNIFAADFNGDGRPDVVTRTSTTEIHLFITYEDGTLGPPMSVHSTTGLSGLAVADVNGDGKLDLIIAGSAPEALTVLPSNGDGSFGAAITSPIAVDPAGLAIADFNGDDKIDVVVRSLNDLAVALYTGDGAGNFALLLNRPLASAPQIVVSGDIDADDKADYVVGYGDTTPYEVHYGNGDGTFQTVFPLSSLAAAATRMLIEDLDADGDLEIIATHFAANTLTVVANNGSRTFASPLVYPVLPVAPPSGNPFDIVVADMNGDGDADVVTTLANEKYMATFTGNGDGSLNSPAYVYAGGTPYGQYAPQYLATADFTGDGRPDIALAGSIFIALYKNRSGEVDLLVSREYPTIAAGQTATFSVLIRDAQFAHFTQYPPPGVTGTVTLKEDGVEIGSATVSNNAATIELPSLAVGMHAITAHYSGDDSYRATASAPVLQNVSADTTSVTLTNSASGPLEYAEGITLTATVTSTSNEPLDGPLWIYRNDDLVSSWQGPTAQYQAILGPGTYTYRAVFRGTETLPPSTSEIVTQVVIKGTSITTLGQVFVQLSDQTTVGVSLTGKYRGSPGGNVRLYNGSTLLTTVSAVAPYCCDGTSVQIPLSLPVGVHYLHAVYEGDANFEPSTSGVTRYVVVPDQGFAIEAWVQEGSIRVRGLYDLPAGGYFKIYSRRGTVPGWIIYQGPVASWIELEPDPNTPYLFRMEAYNSSNQLLASSNTEMAMVYAFADDPLVRGTVVKSLHFTELGAATNTLRTAASLGAISIDTSPGHVIEAAHVLQLRAAINEARVALGASPVAYTDAVAPGLPVRASHVQELRDAIR